MVELAGQPLEAKDAELLRDRPSEQLLQKSQRLVKKFLTVVAFTALALPGLFCIFVFCYAGLSGLLLPDALYILVKVLPRALKTVAESLGPNAGLSTNIIGLGVSIFPALVMTAVFSGDRLNRTGVICLGLLLIGTAANLGAYLLFEIDYFIKDFGPQDAINGWKALCQSAGSIDFIYLLVLLRMRPAP